jgi:hypothetical protein
MRSTCCALLPVVLHVVIALAAGCSVGSEFRRRSVRTWLACAGGNPIVALAGKLAPVQDLRHPHVLGGADPGGIVRDLVQR